MRRLLLLIVLWIVGALLVAATHVLILGIAAPSTDLAKGLGVKVLADPFVLTVAVPIALVVGLIGAICHFIFLRKAPLYSSYLTILGTTVVGTIVTTLIGPLAGLGGSVLICFGVMTALAFRLHRKEKTND